MSIPEQTPRIPERIKKKGTHLNQSGPSLEPRVVKSASPEVYGLFGKGYIAESSLSSIR